MLSKKKKNCERLWNGPNKVTGWLGPMGQIGTMAYFYTAFELWITFVFFKKVMKWNNTKQKMGWINDKECVWPIKPNIWSFIENVC